MRTQSFSLPFSLKFNQFVIPFFFLCVFAFAKSVNACGAKIPVLFSTCKLLTIWYIFMPCVDLLATGAVQIANFHQNFVPYFMWFVCNWFAYYTELNSINFISMEFYLFICFDKKMEHFYLWELITDFVVVCLFSSVWLMMIASI